MSNHDELGCLMPMLPMHARPFGGAAFTAATCHGRTKIIGPEVKWNYIIISYLLEQLHADISRWYRVVACFIPMVKVRRQEYRDNTYPQVIVVEPSLC